VTSSDDKKDETIKTKTLSLSLGGDKSPDISKILEEKSKAQKGKIEFISTKSSKKDKTDSLQNDTVEPKGHLTSAEKELRLKLASQEIDDVSSASPVVSNFKIVKKEVNKKPVEEELEITKQEAEEEKKVDILVEEILAEEDQSFSTNAPSHIIKSSFEVKVVENNAYKIAEKNRFEKEQVHIQTPTKTTNDFKDTKSFSVESEEDKKSKKKLAELEARRANAPKNWKSAYVVVEEDSEDDAEDGVVEEYKPRKIYPVKRKNKRKNLTKEKIIRDVEVYNEISVKDLALRMSEKAPKILRFLAKLDDNLNVDSILDAETAELVITEFGHRAVVIDTSSVESQYFIFNDKLEELEERPPVVTIMGHVDHGKTTLLDTIRKANIASKEAGGITQHIGAYQVKSKDGKLITFLDTPGHEAFGQIRARGSKVTDIVVLVVSADDGIKPQTVEAINHAKVAGVPIIVAINKMDKPDANAMKVRTELLSHDLVVEEMGGDILSVEISAKNNTGIDKLLETILLQAEILDLKTNYKALGKASVIEVKQEKGFGYLASVLVERGTLRLGDYFVCGLYTGKIKVMINDKGERLKEAGPATPIEVSGFNGSVNAGDSFVVVKNESSANELVQYRAEKASKVEKKDTTQSILDFLTNELNELKTLNVIVKTDTQGSLEAIKSSLDKIIHKDIEVKMVHSGVGEITESDIMLSNSGSAIIFGFNSRANAKARDLAKREGIELRYHSIIYNLVDDVKLILTGMLDPDVVENIIGYAQVREVFNVSKVGNVAGCYVTEGILKRSAFVRVLRENVVVHDGVLSQLKRFKDDAKEVKHEYECGVALEGYNDVRVGDQIECYEKVEVRNSVD
jgi:translation initiation factor IF-2